MKKKLEDHAEYLKNQQHQDLKNQLVIYKKNMIDAVESKCFDLDEDVDKIRS
jgi:hypothetical protein